MERKEIKDERISNKMPAPNERFHASGGVARPEGSANLQVLCPAQTAVSRRLREAATALYASRTAQCDWEAKK
jgi:hypothetical protein